MVASLDNIRETVDLDFFEEISKGTTLVAFIAEWCSPCRMQLPILENLRRDLGNKLKVLKLNVDDNKATATFYRISGVPTLILFKEGKVVKEFQGMQALHFLEAEIQKQI
ncbi:MAG: redoxin domain-containing protein [Bacteroidales bacterium]|nr:redoxin domain-containing protein [Bacteroidales bacterium]